MYWFVYLILEKLVINVESGRFLFYYFYIIREVDSLYFIEFLRRLRKVFIDGNFEVFWIKWIDDFKRFFGNFFFKLKGDFY